MLRRHWFVMLFALICISGCAREPRAQTYLLLRSGLMSARSENGPYVDPGGR